MSLCVALLLVNMSGSKAGSNVNEVDGAGNAKRNVTLTGKAVACKVEKLQKERQSKVSKIKGVITALKEVMKGDNNASQVQSQLDVLMHLHDGAISLHKSLMPLIPQEVVTVVLFL